MHPAAAAQRYGRRQRGLERGLHIDRPLAGVLVRDLDARKRGAQLGDDGDIVGNDALRHRRQPQRQRGGKTGRRKQLRRRIEPRRALGEGREVGRGDLWR